MSNTTLNLTPDLYHYLQTHSLREPDILKALRRETAAMPMAVMQIAPEQGQFMAMLVKLLNAKRIIEVGVFTGYSTLSMALALPEDGRLIACDINEEWTSVAQRYWHKAGVAEKIDLHLAPALDTLQTLSRQGGQRRFDMAFIDADKGNYSAYYDAILPLLRSGGLMVIDNVLWSGAVADPIIQDDDTRALREFNRKVHNDQRVDISMLPIADGLTLLRKR